MIMETEAVAAGMTPSSDTFRLRARDVTGTLDLEVEDLQRNVPAGALARSLAQRMALPANVPWALRDDRGAFLDEELEIGRQVSTNGDARVTLTPKSHLG